MQILKFICLLALHIEICAGTKETSCAKIKPCQCRPLSYSKVGIDCRGMRLGIGIVCAICDKIEHVQSLDVGGNNLSTIPKACFDKCAELEELHLDSNNLTELTKDAFIGLNALKRLNMYNNSLIIDGELYDPELFKYVYRLEELRIQKNLKRGNPGIACYLSNVARESLGSLKRLYLDGWSNGRFGINFRNYTKLSKINLSGSPIFSTSNETFKNVPYIESLDMSYCNLTHVGAGTFEPLKALKFLNLSNNMGLGFPSLRDISYGLRDSTSIETLDYSKVYKTFGLTTQLNRCDVWYLQNTTLRTLYINSNRMAFIELDALRLMPSTLEEFFMEDNQLALGPYAHQAGCLTNLKRLELGKQYNAHILKSFNDELSITDNELDSSKGCQLGPSHRPDCWSGKHKPLKSYDFHFPYNLKHIGFSHSNIRYEPSFYTSPLPLRNSIESADFSYNVIYKWNDPLVIFHDMKLLNLSHNFCSNITEYFFRNFPNLETFDASYNKIGRVLEHDVDGLIFSRVDGLRVLHISACWIAELPEKGFIHLRSLEHLDLSYNMLESVEFDFEHMVNLTTLSLRQNKITALPLKLLKQMEKAAKTSGKNLSIDLSENTLDAVSIVDDTTSFLFLQHRNVQILHQ